MNMLENDRVFFNPGDIVTVRHDLENKPKMYVIEKVTRSLLNKESGAKETMFLGIRCRWFDKNSVLHEEIFSTKDLEHVN